VQSRSLTTARLHRADFDLVLRELISKMQAFSQRINKASMVRLYSSVDLDDIVLAMSCDSAFHGVPPSIAAATMNEDRMLGSVPRRLTVYPNSCPKLASVGAAV
jgi:hypothetical protein